MDNYKLSSYNSWFGPGQRRILFPVFVMMMLLIAATPAVAHRG